MEYCVEPNEIARKLARNPVTIKDGYAHLPTEPGLGVELREDVCEAHPWSGPQLHLSMVPRPVGG